MTSERDLMPCPMCGSDRVGVHKHKQRRAVGYKAMCGECGLSQTVVAHGSIEAAAAAWNRRAQHSTAEPFGYFRAEPFGWTDCAATDEGAVPLYAAPQQAPDHAEGLE